MARKRATSKAQLIHAQAAPAAQLVTAHAQTQTASAPTATASVPTASRRRGASVNPVLPSPVQVGGEKQHHQGFATQTATVGGTDLSLHQLRDGSYELRDPNGNVRRRYSGGQMANVTRRGNSGATMDPLDQAAFFRIGGGQTAEEKEEAKRVRLKKEAEQDEATKKAMALKARGLDIDEIGLGADNVKNIGILTGEEAKLNNSDKLYEMRQQKDAQFDLYKRQQEFANQQKLAEEKRLKKQAEEENAAFNAKYGIDEGTQLSQRDKDDIAAGRSRWGYSAQDQQSIDDINKAFSEGKYDKTKKGYYVGDDGLAHQLKEGDSGYTGQDLITEHDAFRRNADAQIAGFRKGVQKNTDERTAEQIYNGAFEINGVRYYSPDGRSLVPIDEGQKAQAARDARAQERADAQQIRAQERADNRADALQKRIDDYEKSVIDKLMTPQGDNENGMSFDEALAEARKRSAAFFAQPTAQTTTQPTAQPTTAAAPVPPTDPNDPLSAFSQFRH